MREVHTPPPDAVPAEMSDGELEAVAGGGQKNNTPVVARALPPQWGGRASKRAAAVRPVAAPVAAVTAGGCAGGCAGGVCAPR